MNLRGQSVLEVDEATLLQAVDMWLRATFRDDQVPEATSVQPKGFGYKIDTFTITLLGDVGQVDAAAPAEAAS